MPYLQLRDLKLYYEVHGEGRPFLFISETACHGEVWKPYQVPEFSRDHRVIIYDQRGTGRTDKPSMEYTTTTLANDAAALLDHLGADQVIVYGHSMGGRIAQLVALDHPQKVSKLILASSGASHSTRGIPLKMCLELVEKGYEKYARAHAVRIGFTERFVSEHPERVEEFLKIRLANLPPLESYLLHVMARQAHDTGDRLKDIRVPTLVMVGDDEAKTTSDISHWASAEILARSIPNAKLVVLPDSGHYYFFAKPEETNRAIREFLRET
ncbi:MAG TPA: alpha/beta fold hydrolase [Candidatus Binatia bacterium]